jgi:hypothetical protein
MHGSLIQRHPKQFNIERLEYAPIDMIMYPFEFLEKEFIFVYNFKRKILSTNYPWESLVEEWKKERESFELEGITRQTTINRLVFYFIDGGSFIKIYDKRDRQNIRIFVLNKLERAVFLACVDVVSLQQLQQRFINVPEFELIAMLQSFEQNGLVFVEDKHYVCLPLRFSIGERPVIRTECQVNAVA